jgi:hypothetical protein
VSFWRRKQRDNRSPGPRGQEQQFWTRRPDPTQALYGHFKGDDMPDALTPKITGRDKVYEDEVDPSWRDPDTAE